MFRESDSNKSRGMVYIYACMCVHVYCLLSGCFLYRMYVRFVFLALHYLNVFLMPDVYLFYVCWLYLCWVHCLFVLYLFCFYLSTFRLLYIMFLVPYLFLVFGVCSIFCMFVAFYGFFKCFLAFFSVIWSSRRSSLWLSVI